MVEKLLEKCLFYRLDGENVDVCVYADGGWGDSFIAINVNSKTFMLHGESNLHQGEKPNRELIAKLLTNGLFSITPLYKLPLVEIPQAFIDSIKDYFNNKNKS